MKKARFKARSVEAAVKGALEILGVDKENANIRVISEGKPGVLGVIGGEDAEVEVSEKMSLAEVGRAVLQEILDKMEVMAIVEIVESPEDRIGLNIKGEGMGRIIGKEGATLQALQTIIGSILSKEAGGAVRVDLDADGYRKKHEDALRRIAINAAKDVEKSKQEKVLPEMSANDRRIIHTALKDYKGVQTFSKGEGKERRLVIAPK
jgi:spoIIIJ-associated protein